MPKRVLFDKNSAAKTSGSDKRKFKFDARNLALIPVIVIMLIFGALTNPAFFTANNLLGNILTTSAVLGIMVIAEGIILIGGFFDLSLQSIVGFAPMTLAVLLSKNSDVPGVGLNIIFAILLTIAAVVIIGLLNGLIVSKMKINAFIATLAMMILVQGFTLGISNGQTYSDLPRFMTFMGDTRILAIPFEAWIFVILFALAYAFMRLTPTGRNIYAMGGNFEAARAAGVKTTKLTILLFISGGLLAAFAGFLLTGRIASVTADQGNGLIFTVFAASVIGGISLNGGRGNLVGAAFGVIVLGIIDNILTLSNVPSFWINAAYGAIILGALLIGWLASRKSPGRGI